MRQLHVSRRPYRQIAPNYSRFIHLATYLAGAESVGIQ